jgi:porphobilinogen synthase
MYLQRRNRITRQSAAIRSMVAETSLSPNDFIVPLFIDEGTNVKTEISSMPGYYRNSLDVTVNEVKDLWSMGLKECVALCKIKRRIKR